MKSLKINVALIAVVLGLAAAFAFKAPAPKTNFTTAWFSYTGLGDPTDPANYVLDGSMPSCSGSTTVCAILATNDGGSPDIPITFADEINADLSGHHSSADVKLRN